MKLPDYIGIKERRDHHYLINGYEYGSLITKVKVDSEEAVLDTVEKFILRGFTFEVFELSKVVIEYEDDDGEMQEFEK